MKKTLSGILSFAALAFILSPLLAVADTTAGANASVTATPPSVTVKASAAVLRGQQKGDQEIDRRIKNLNALVERVQAMRNLSDADKTSIAATLTAQIGALQELRAKVDADTDAATLKTDVESITGSYRIYALIIPQGAIIAAADRIVTVAGTLKLIAAKFDARIAAAASAGNDTAAVQKVVDEYNAKILDSAVQAQGAVNDIVALVPDQGDAAKQKANTEALKGARAKIILAQKDLQIARKDADKIITALKGMKVGATATTTVETQ
jgi:hypothetical protein